MERAVCSTEGRVVASSSAEVHTSTTRTRRSTGYMAFAVVAQGLYLESRVGARHSPAETGQGQSCCGRACHLGWQRISGGGGSGGKLERENVRTFNEHRVHVTVSPLDFEQIFLSSLRHLYSQVPSSALVVIDTYSIREK